MKAYQDSEDMRCLQEAIDCAQSALHYLDCLPLGRMVNANIKRMEATVASLMKAHASMMGNVEENVPAWLKDRESEK